MKFKPENNQQKQVQTWMRMHSLEHLDPCGEVNNTELAEAAAVEFNLHEDDADATIPEWVFDCAAEF